MIDEKFKFCAMLEQLIAEEAEARESYYFLMASYLHLLTKDEISEVKEIISEELKHSNILSRIVERITEIRAEE